MRIGEIVDAQAREQRIDARAIASPACRRDRCGSPPSCATSASATLSRTVIDANVAATWNVRPTPRRAIACVG